MADTIRRLDGVPCYLDGSPILAMAICNGRTWRFALSKLKQKVHEDASYILDAKDMVKANTAM